MKKSTRIILMVSICLISVGIVFSAIGFFAGASPSQIVFGGLWNYQFHHQNNYENDHNENNTYRISDRTIDSLEIDWQGGGITVVPYDGEDIVIKESSRSKLTDKNCLRYKLDGNTLQIDFLQETAGISFSRDSDPKDSKTLTVKLPESLAQNLDEVNVDALSSDLNIKDARMESLTMDTTSGSLLADQIEAGYLEMGTTSGNMHASFLRCPEKFSFSSTSGNCTVTLPKRSSAAVFFYSTSGKFSTEFRCRESQDDEVYIIGEGQNEFSMDTLSGSLRIRKAAN